MNDIAQPEAGARGDRTTSQSNSHLFTVRLWKEEVEGGFEYRGSVRDVVRGAFRAFRRWSDLTDFMVVQIEDAPGPEDDPIEGGT